MLAWARATCQLKTPAEPPTELSAATYTLPWKLLVGDYDRLDVPNRDSAFWEQPQHEDLRWG